MFHGVKGHRVLCRVNCFFHFGEADELEACRDPPLRPGDSAAASNNRFHILVIATVGHALA